MTRFLACALAALLAAALLLAAAVAGHAERAAPLPDPERIAAALDTGLPLARFTELIGRPPDVDTRVGEYGLFRELLWLDDDRWAVQAIVDTTDPGIVCAYSVTTRSAAVRPAIAPLGGARLGATPLDAYPGFRGDPHLVGTSSAGNWSWSYSEAVQASDRTFVLTASDASAVGVDAGTEAAVRGLFVPDPLPEHGANPVGPMVTVAGVNDERAARHHVVPTTWTVIGPGTRLADLPDDLRFGPA